MISTVTEAFGKAVEELPEHCAVRCGDDSLSYAELDTISSRAAGRLARSGVRPGDVVGIQMRQGIDRIVMLLAILKAGGSYCYVSERNPATWNNAVIERAGISAFVSENTLRNARFPRVFGSAGLLAPGCCDLLSAAPMGRDIVYVNFSSGTTGAPKIIPCPHAGVIGFCYRPRHFHAGPGTVMLHHSALTFDASQFEIWTALCNGGTLVLPVEDWLTGDGLRREIAQHGINAMWLTVSLFNSLMEADPGCLEGVADIMIGGEELSSRHVDLLYRSNGTITVYNGYGPTENTMGTCIYEIPRDHDFSERIPIGYPVQDSRLHVIDEQGNACADGEVGELIIAGAGLAPEYKGDPDLTDARFRSFPDLGEARAYASGDLVFRDGRGRFHYVGRADDQIKIRGNRTSLGDIAAAYTGHPDILSGVATVQSVAGGKRVTLFYVPQSPTRQRDEDQMRSFGKTHLPDFMVPDEFIAVDSLPVTAHGKIDLRQLERRRLADLAGKDREAPGVHWLLDRCGLGQWAPDQNFFQAGGDSISAVKLVTLINQHLTEPLKLSDFYSDCSWSRISALLDGIAGPAGDEAGAEDYDYYVIRL